MILGIELPVTTLDRWLQIATCDLVASAKERIRAEIEAHYTEAVASHMAQGVSKAEAEMAALAELGPAPAAAKKFSRQYLSESAISCLESHLKWLGNWPFLLFWYSMFFVFLRFIFYKQETILLFILQFIGFVVLPTVLFRIARHQRGKPNAFWVCWLAVLEPLPFMGMLLNLSLLHLKNPDEIHFMGLIICLSLSSFNFCCQCLAWKRHYLKWKQIGPETPPQDAALS